MPVEDFYDYDDDYPFLIGFFESPKTLKQIKKLRKEFKKMTVSLDRLNASIDALSAKVDEHIANDDGGSLPATGATEAEVNAAADKVDAIKAKFDVAIPVGTDIGNDDIGFDGFDGFPAAADDVKVDAKDQAPANSNEPMDPAGSGLTQAEVNARAVEMAKARGDYIEPVNTDGSQVVANDNPANDGFQR